MSTQSKAPVKIISTLPPILTITPATLPTQPMTPISPVSIRSVSSTTSVAIPETPPSPSSHPLPLDTPHSLHYPLTRHLTMIHPQTPSPIISFVATRLLSKDRPYGYEGEWTPLWETIGDLSTAGVGKDAGKRCRQKEGGGKECDKVLEEMYGVARSSWGLLEMDRPAVDKL